MIIEAIGFCNIFIFVASFFPNNYLPDFLHVFEKIEFLEEIFLVLLFLIAASSLKKNNPTKYLVYTVILVFDLY